MTTIFVITNLLQATLRRVLQLSKKDLLGNIFSCIQIENYTSMFDKHIFLNRLKNQINKFSTKSNEKQIYRYVLINIVI